MIEDGGQGFFIALTVMVSIMLVFVIGIIWYLATWQLAWMRYTYAQRENCDESFAQFCASTSNSAWYALITEKKEK